MIVNIEIDSSEDYILAKQFRDFGIIVKGTFYKGTCKHSYFAKLQRNRIIEIE